MVESDPQSQPLRRVESRHTSWSHQAIPLSSVLKSSAIENSPVHQGQDQIQVQEQEQLHLILSCRQNRPDEPQPLVYGPPHRLRRKCTNTISNKSKLMSPNSSLRSNKVSTSLYAVAISSSRQSDLSKLRPNLRDQPRIHFLLSTR